MDPNLRNPREWDTYSIPDILLSIHPHGLISVPSRDPIPDKGPINLLRRVHIGATRFDHSYSTSFKNVSTFLLPSSHITIALSPPPHTMSSQSQINQDVLKRLKSVQLLALNLGVPKRTIDPWKEEIESHLVKLSMSSPDQSFQGWEKVEESLKEMQTLLKGDQTVSFEIFALLMLFR